jgi:hypothetical protein
VWKKKYELVEETSTEELASILSDWEFSSSFAIALAV